MILRNILKLVAMVLAIFTASTANALLIDFNEFVVAPGMYTGDGRFDGDVISQKFLFDFSTDHHHLANDIGQSCNGTTYLVTDDWGGRGHNVLTMSMVSGGIFDLNSLELAEFIPPRISDESADLITVTGSGGQTLTMDMDNIGDGSGPGDDFQLEVFNWAGLTWVTFDAITGVGDRRWAMDNIDVNVVPEPGTIALFGLGIMGLVMLRRRRRRSKK